MVSIDLAVVLVALAVAQVPGAPPETPGELAAKQSAAKSLTDDLIARYLVVYVEVAASNAGGEGEGEAQDRAQEQAIRAAARKAGLSEAQLEGVGLLIQEFLQPRMQLIQRAAMASQFEQQIKALEARGEKPPAYLVAQRDALRKPPAGGVPSVAAFEKKYGKAPTRVLERNQEKIVAAQQAVVERAMAAAGASSGTGGPPPASVDSCPPSQRSGPTGREWCMRRCTMDVLLPGAQGPRTVECSVTAFTSPTRSGISIGPVAEGRGAPLATIRVDLKRDPGNLAGTGFDSARGGEVKAVASGEARSFSVDCAGRPGGSATVNIEAAWASGKNAADRTQQWQVHGVAKATVVDCTDGGTAEVVARF